MPLNQFLLVVHQQIGRSKISDAFEFMREFINPRSSYYDDLLLAQSNFSLIEKEYHRGKIVFPDYALACSKTNDAILNLCKQLQINDLLNTNLLLAAKNEHDLVKDKEKGETMPPIPNKESNALTDIKAINQQVSIHMAKAKKMVKQGLIGDAITELRKAHTLKPDDVRIKTELAATLRHANQHMEAIEILTSILEKDPQDEHSRNELAFCYRETDKLDLAIEILEEGLKIAEKNNHFHTNLFGIHLFFTCEKEKALSVKNNYSKLTNGNSLFVTDSVRHLYDSFIHHFDDIHSGEADYDLIGLYLGECFHTKKAYKTAAIILSKLLQSKPQSFWFKNARQKLPPQYDSLFERY